MLLKGGDLMQGMHGEARGLASLNRGVVDQTRGRTIDAEVDARTEFKVHGRISRPDGTPWSGVSVWIRQSNRANIELT